jgi:hypothetical protein
MASRFAATGVYAHAMAKAKGKAAGKLAVKLPLRAAPAPASALASRATWDAIAAAVASSRAKLGFDVPTDIELPGCDIGIAVRALQLELGKHKPIGAVAHLKALYGEIEATALDALGEHLSRAWCNDKRDVTTRWLVDAAGAIGGDRTASLLGAFLWDHLRDNTMHHNVLAAADALAAMATRGAAQELVMLAELPSRYEPRRAHARRALGRVAQRLGTTPGELALTCAPRVADARCRQRIEAVWARRYERWMVDGERFRQPRLRAALGHPIVEPITRRIVFGVCASGERGELRAGFRPGRDGPVDATGRPVAVGDDAAIGVAHPVELAAIGELDAWLVAFARQDADQPFLQLERTIHRLTAAQAAANLISDVRQLRRDWLHEQCWIATKDDDDWAGDADGFYVVMARDRKRIECKLAGDGTIAAIGMGEVVVDWRGPARAGDPTPLGELHPVSQAELLYAFLGQRERPPRAIAAEPQVAAVASRYPYAELAKTSRSACLQCAQKIEKGAVRVAVERRVDSDAFKGTGTGYVHAACVAAYPELAALPDRDRVIAANSQIPWP